MKICTKCSESKKLSDFYIKRNTSDGYASVCKTCKSIIDKDYRERNKEKLKQKQLIYINENKEFLSLQKKKKYHSATQQEIKERKRKASLKAKNAPEHVKQRKREYDKKYFKTEKGKKVIHNSIRKRRAQRLSSEDGTVTFQALENLKIKQDNKCYYCKEILVYSTKHAVHLDHFIPLAKGGIHSITNVVWSCSSCNHKKSDILNYKFK